MPLFLVPLFAGATGLFAGSFATRAGNNGANMFWLIAIAVVAFLIVMHFF